ncbi:hypothetical protein GQ600_15068 [Phytophthora cactorum]|nr:hypothetical protein GQ600_15068 [Phytophthora cactorum]
MEPWPRTCWREKRRCNLSILTGNSYETPSSCHEAPLEDLSTRHRCRCTSAAHLALSLFVNDNIEGTLIYTYIFYDSQPFQELGLLGKLYYLQPPPHSSILTPQDKQKHRYSTAPWFVSLALLTYTNAQVASFYFRPCRDQDDEVAAPQFHTLGCLHLAVACDFLRALLPSASPHAGPVPAPFLPVPVPRALGTLFPPLRRRHATLLASRSAQIAVALARDSRHAFCAGFLAPAPLSDAVVRAPFLDRLLQRGLVRDASSGIIQEVYRIPEALLELTDLGNDVLRLTEVCDSLLVDKRRDLCC